MRRRAAEAERGRGQLSYVGGRCDVDYEFTGDAKRLNGSGVLNGSPDEMRAVFSAGQATLTFEDGRPISIIVVAQTAGDVRAFFEVRTARAY